jgi:hypothetical protein
VTLSASPRIAKRGSWVQLTSNEGWDKVTQVIVDGFAIRFQQVNRNQISVLIPRSWDRIFFGEQSITVVGTPRQYTFWPSYPGMVEVVR